jgi:hypothetical protein
MKRYINSTTVERGVKRVASDELGGEGKKLMVDRHSYEKQASSIAPKFISAAKITSSTRTNVQMIPEISDDELLAMAIEFEKKNPQ